MSNRSEQEGNSNNVFTYSPGLIASRDLNAAGINHFKIKYSKENNELAAEAAETHERNFDHRNAGASVRSRQSLVFVDGEPVLSLAESGICVVQLSVSDQEADRS